MAGLTEITPGVLISTSTFDLTTSTAVAGRPGSGRCLLIDPGVSPGELAALAAGLGQRGLRPAAAWSTHPHWDHVLWSRELGEVPRYAAPAAAAVLRSGRGALVAEAAAAVPGLEADLIGRVTPLDAAAIGWDGPAARLIVHDGHAPGHGAVFLPGPGVLVAGDMCSDTEIPLLDLAAADPVGGYRDGLGRLAAVPRVRLVVPGHGHAGDAAELGRRIALDLAYLDALAGGGPVTDPRLGPAAPAWLHAAHEEQLRFMRH